MKTREMHEGDSIVSDAGKSDVQAPVFKRLKLVREVVRISGRARAAATNCYYTVTSSGGSVSSTI